MSNKRSLSRTNLTWSYPGGPGRGDGMVWYGVRPATDLDITAIRLFLQNSTAPVDERSLVGRYHRDWNSAGYATVAIRNRNGGIGSSTYESQHVSKDQVSFSKRDMWHYDADGEFIMGVPAEAGAYWKDDLGDGAYNYYAGPKPDSAAWFERGTGKYAWDEEHFWIVIVPE